MLSWSLRARGHVLAAALLVLTTIAVYLPVRGHAFVNYDDGVYVTENPHVRTGLSAENVAWALTATHGANWHPVTWLSHMVDCQLFGLDPGAHHLTNLFLHLANTLLLLFVLGRLTGRPWPSLAVASLFALHPLHVESVAWVAERKDVLSAFFLLLTIWAYARYAEHPSPARYVETLVLFALGLLSKPMLVTVPFLLLLLDLWPLGRVRIGSPGDRARPAGAVEGSSGAIRAAESSIGRLVLEKTPFLALSIASSVMTVVAQRKAGALATIDEVTPVVRVANALVAYVGYLVQMVWPARLSVFYPLPAEAPFWRAAGAALILAAASALAILAVRRRPYVTVGWFWYMGTLVPVIGVVQVGLQSMADRYTYVPLIGIFVIVAWGAAELGAERPRLRTLLSFATPLALGVLMLLTARQVAYWKDTRTLFQRAFDASAENHVTHYHLANVLAAEGRTDEAVRHYEEAIRLRPAAAAAHNNLGLVLAGLDDRENAAAHYREALRIKPDYAEAHNNLGSLLGREGRRVDAIAHFTEALRLKPDYAEAHNNFGVAAGNLGRLDEAAAHFREGLRLSPDLVDARNNLGFVLARQGRIGEAMEQFKESIRLDPDSADAHYYMAVAAAGQGRSGEALREYREALRVRPDWPEALNNLALILATDEDPKIRDGREAVVLAERACELTDHQHALVLDTLGVAYAEVGRFNEAVDSAERALAIARSSGQSELAAHIESRLEQYRSRVSQDGLTGS